MPSVASTTLLLLAMSQSAELSVGRRDCRRTANMPATFRMERYRRPTPVCVPGATTLSTSDLDALLAARPDTLLIDVWATLLRTEKDFGSEWLVNSTHESLPGAVWLPNVGYGELNPIVERYFKRTLAEFTADNPSRPLVFFCVADCWMSWNAVQRAKSYGYDSVFWYRLGTDGWQDAGRALQAVSPEPIDALDD